MRIVFGENDTIDVPAIQSVSVITVDKRIIVNYKTEDTKEERHQDLPCRKGYFRKKWAEEIAADLEAFSKSPDTPIEQVIASTAWAVGYLQVKLDTNSDICTQALACLCCDWVLNQTPTYEQLEFRTGLSADEINEFASSDIYKKHVKRLMLKEYDTPDKFNEWLRVYGGNMPRQFGKRMRLSEDAATELINSIAEQYCIDLGDRI